MDADLLRADLAAYYPQFGLRVAHAGLVLLPPTDVELFELAAIVAEPGGIVAPERVGDWLGWPDAGTGAAVRRFLEQAWRLREAPRRECWRAPFAVLDAGRAVGLTMLHHRPEHAAGSGYTVETWSWLARAEQGRGLGRRARLMLLELAFDHLGAARAVTGAAADNSASLRVSRRCGYTESHRETGADGVVEVSLAVTAAAWRRRRLGDVVVDGAEAFVAALDL